MREGCELIVRLKVDKVKLQDHIRKHGEKFFDVIVGKLNECEDKHGGCFGCPDLKRCDVRWNGICKKAQGISPPFAAPI